jgi:hypothetical protein
VTEQVTGYLHSGYAESLSEFGLPRQLLRSRGWILQRPIPASDFQDAMGCYPIFSCVDWIGLADDLADLKSELVSAVIVTDPFGDFDVEYLSQCFHDVVIPFKQHFVTDLSRAPETFLDPHHRRNIRKALRSVEIQHCESPSSYLDDWMALYGTLVMRHGITGMAAFSRASFAMQFSVPGMVALRAARGVETVGMLLWFLQGNRAYYHLGAYSPEGYDVRASFALFSYSIEYFAKLGIEWLSLGAGAGAAKVGDSGLDRFKQGWSTGTRIAYLCGRIFDRERYQELTRARSDPPTNYFPAYRAGEFS